MRIDGVSGVSVWSGRDLVLWIVLDEDNVRSLGVDIDAVLQRLTEENFALSSGHVREGERRIMVRSVAMLSSLASHLQLFDK